MKCTKISYRSYILHFSSYIAAFFTAVCLAFSCNVEDNGITAETISKDKPVTFEVKESSQTKTKAEGSDYSSDRILSSSAVYASSNGDSLYLNVSESNWKVLEEAEEVSYSTKALSAPSPALGVSPYTSSGFASGDSFGLLAYTYKAADASTPNKWTQYTSSAVKIEKSGSNWVQKPTSSQSLIYWPFAKNKIRFVAYAPYSKLTANTATAGKPSIKDFTVNSSYSSQVDILVADTERDDNPAMNNLKVPLTFSHALTGVRFRSTNGLTIKSIKISGVISKASLDIVSRSWTLSSTTGTFTLSSSALSGSYRSQDPANSDYQIFNTPLTMMMIPQTLPSGSKIEAVINDGTTDKTITCNLYGHSWQQGKLITYTLSTTSIEEGKEYVLDFPSIVEVANSSESVTSPLISFSSYSWDGKTTESKTAEPVDVTYSLSPQGPFYSYNSSSMPTALRNIISNTENPFTYTSGINVNDAEFALLGNNQYEEGADNRASRKLKLQSRAENGYTQSAPQDLSLMRPVSETMRDQYHVTANCYIVQRAGWYMLPCVFGNSIVGIQDTYRYNPSGTNSATFLKPFLGHTGASINNAYIHKYTPINLTVANFINRYEAVVLWQDVALEDGFLTIPAGSSATTAPGHGLAAKTLYEIMSTTPTAVETPYICFNIDKSKIQEGNVVIGLRRKGTTDIVWSWHIWVTAEDLSARKVTNNTGREIHLLSVPLGWNLERSRAYKERKLYAKVAQQSSGKTIICEVTQAANENEKFGNAPYYQFGRKDPFPPGPAYYYSTAQKHIKTISYPTTGYVADADEHLRPIVPTAAKNAITNPLRIYNTIYNNHATWIPNKAPINLWHTGEAGVNKEVYGFSSVYSPCPPVFEVVPAGFNTGFSKYGQGAGGSNYRTHANVMWEKNSGVNGIWFKSDDGQGIYIPFLGWRSTSGDKIHNGDTESKFFTSDGNRFSMSKTSVSSTPPGYDLAGTSSISSDQSLLTCLLIWISDGALSRL